MDRTPLIAGNWKMHKLPSEAAAWLETLLDRRATGRAELLLCVPATHLPGMSRIASGTSVRLGAQDASAHEQGAYTGEVSAAMLADAGARYAIVGHSERRAYHHEDDALVGAKLRAASAAGLVPILCVGEKEGERDAGRAEAVVLGQLAGALDGFAPEDADGPGVADGPSVADGLVVAYEPVWAIGTGRTATADDAQAMSAAVRGALRERYGEAGDGVRVLYGGSMKPGNAEELLAKPDVDGGLIGGASLEVDSLLAILDAAR